jgi:hypothetical protein
MNIASIRIFAAFGLLAASACEKSETPAAGSATASAASASPAKTSAATGAPATAAATASAAAAPSCPDAAMKWDDFFKQCTSTGDVRMAEGKWTGKIEDKAVFTITNKSTMPFSSFGWNIYFYDAGGKQLDYKIPDQPSAPIQRNAELYYNGNMPLKPGESRDFNAIPKDAIPKGMKTMEVEVRMVSWDREPGQDKLGWSNKGLVPKERPKSQ